MKCPYCNAEDWIIYYNAIECHRCHSIYKASEIEKIRQTKISHSEIFNKKEGIENVYQCQV